MIGCTLPSSRTSKGGLLLSVGLYQWEAISIRGRVFSYAGNNDLPQFVHRIDGTTLFVQNRFTEEI